MSPTYHYYYEQTNGRTNNANSRVALRLKKEAKKVQQFFFAQILYMQCKIGVQYKGRSQTDRRLRELILLEHYAFANCQAVEQNQMLSNRGVKMNQKGPHIADLN